MAIMIKTPQEIEKMRRSGAAVRAVLEHVKALVRPGVTTLDLENAAESKMAELGATSAFKGYRGYPCVLCTSVNEQVVHGIPSKERVLKEGDIVSIDCGVVLDGYYGDSAITVPVGKSLSPELQKLLEVTGMWGRKCRNTLKPMASAWCASLWGMESALDCMKIRRCRITAHEAMARGCV